MLLKSKEIMRYAPLKNDIFRREFKKCQKLTLDLTGTAEGAGGDQRRSVVRARKVFCRLAVKRMGYSGASVARYLGVTTSLVNRYASSEEVGNLDQYL